MEEEERSTLESYTKEVIFSSCILSALARLCSYLDRKRVEGRHQNAKPISTTNGNVPGCNRYRWKVINNSLSTYRKMWGKRKGGIGALCLPNIPKEL